MQKTYYKSIGVTVEGFSFTLPNTRKKHKRYNNFKRILNKQGLEEIENGLSPEILFLKKKEIEKQINFLLEDIEKNSEEYKKAPDLKGKQLLEAKKILFSAKKSYDKTVAENKELKIYIENIKQRFAQYQQQQQAQFLEKKKQYYEPKTSKKYKRVVYEEELDSEPELEEEENSAKEAKVEPEIKKIKQKKIEKRKKITFLIT